MSTIENAKCVLVVGATSGLGRALALAIFELPSRPVVIAAGRRQDRLKELEDKKLETLQIDVTADLPTLKKTVDSLLTKHPDLDAVILASGIQYQYDFKKEVDLSLVVKEVNVNYIAAVTLVSLFLPHFLKLSDEGRPSFIIPITSGLALMPSPNVSNYSATKAALRSFTISLRAQLKDTHVKVMEIIPPLVESELHDEQGTTPMLSKFWMPLDEYTTSRKAGNNYKALHSLVNVPIGKIRYKALKSRWEMTGEYMRPFFLHTPQSSMDGLKKGGDQIAVGTAEIVLKRFEGLDTPFPTAAIERSK